MLIGMIITPDDIRDALNALIESVRHGNWAGKGWSAGRRTDTFTEQDREVAAIIHFDQVAKEHDIVLSEAEEQRDEDLRQRVPEDEANAHYHHAAVFGDALSRRLHVATAARGREHVPVSLPSARNRERGRSPASPHASGPGDCSATESTGFAGSCQRSPRTSWIGLPYHPWSEPPPGPTLLKWQLRPRGQGLSRGQGASHGVCAWTRSRVRASVQRNRCQQNS